MPPSSGWTSPNLSLRLSVEFGKCPTTRSFNAALTLFRVHDPFRRVNVHAWGTAVNTDVNVNANVNVYANANKREHHQ